MNPAPVGTYNKGMGFRFYFQTLVALILVVTPFSESYCEPSGFIENDPLYMLPVKGSSDYELLNYKLRRPSWTSTLDFFYSPFQPSDYQPSFGSGDFEAVYGSSSAPMFGLNYSVKKNFFLGSIGLETGVGYYKRKSLSSVDVQSDLTLLPVNLGFYYILDNIWREPIVAFYLGGGIYSVNYAENSTVQTDTDELTEEKFTGSTKISTYAKVGLAFQIDWLERESSIQNYIVADIENFFLYVETTLFFKSREETDPKVSGLRTSAGLRVEF